MYKKLNIKRFLFFFLISALFISCDKRKIILSGFNDLVIGSQSLILYDDNSFYLELGAGGMEGKYLIQQDTIRLKYFDEPKTNWPETILIKPDYFVGLDSKNNNKILKIRRNK